MVARIKVKRILKLLEKDLSANKIARTCSISKHSIQAVRTRASELGISYEKAKEHLEELYECVMSIGIPLLGNFMLEETL